MNTDGRDQAETELAALIVMAQVHARRGRRYALEGAVARITVCGAAAVGALCDAMAEEITTAPAVTLDQQTPPLAAYRAGLYVQAWRMGDVAVRDAIVAGLAQPERRQLGETLTLLAATAEQHAAAAVPTARRP